MPVDISYIESQVFYEITVVLAAHQNNDLFSRGTLSCHLDSWFWLQVAFNDVVNLTNLLYIKSRECFLDHKDFQSVCSWFASLSIQHGWFLGFSQFPGFNQRFIVLKVFGYDIYFSL